MHLINSAKQIVNDVTRRLGTNEPLKSDADNIVRRRGNESIEFIALNSSCFIELCERDGSYFYRVMLEKFDGPENCSYFVPAYSENPGAFSSRAKAAAAAKEKAEQIYKQYILNGRV